MGGGRQQGADVHADQKDFAFFEHDIGFLDLDASGTDGFHLPTFEHQTGRFPFSLPESWNGAKARLKLDTKFDQASDNDIIGGNSGSPLINQGGEIVGLVFDGNLPSLGGDYWFEPEVNRTVSVHSAAIVEVLKTVYGAKRVLQELQPSAP